MIDKAETGVAPGIPGSGPKRRHWRLKRLVGLLGLLSAALILWSCADEVGSPVGQAVMYTSAATCLLAALWPHYGAALVLASFMALGIARTLDTVNAWNIAAIIMGSLGAFHLLRRWLPLAWIGASIPFWAMADTVPWLMYVSLGLVYIGFGTILMSPFMVGKPSIVSEPDSRLSNGPLTDVPERLFRFRSGRTLLGITLTISGLAVLAGAILWLTGAQEEGLILMVVGAIIGFSFAFSVWLSSCSHYRIDIKGIHGRVIFREKSIPWEQVCGLFLRYQSLPGLGQRYVYYCIRSPEKVIAFPHTLKGADEFRDLVEKATGMQWPQPAI
jgi:hypothetical protein